MNKHKQQKSTMHQVNKIKKFLKNRPAISVIIIFAVVGTAYLVATNAAAPSVPNGYTQVFLDEFDGPSLDSASWEAYNSTYGDGNFETHCYTPSNVTQSSGTLKILSKEQQITCPSYSSSLGWQTPHRNYTSGFIGSREAGKYYPKYGRYEVRAKSPQRVGLVPAIWLRHINGSSVVEIDMMESFQSSVGSVTSTIHATNGSGGTTYNAWKSTNNIGVTPGWHTWAVEIEEINSNEVEIRFFLDDVQMQKNGGGGPYRITGNAKKVAFDDIGADGFDIAINTAVNFNYSGNAAPDDASWYCKGKEFWSKVSSPSSAPSGSKVAATPMKSADGSTFYRACSSWGTNGSGSIQNNKAGEIFEIDYVRVLVPDSSPPPPEPSTCPVWSYKGQSNAVDYIDEASGIVASRKQPGIFWMHNDSGGTNQIWAVDSTGKVVSRHVLSGAAAQDWEDISLGPGPDSSKDYVYVGDVGDNARARTDAKVYRVPEPTVNPSDNNAQYTISSSLLHTFALSYKLADGSSIKPDVEAMAVDPLTKDIYFFNKSMNSRDQNGVNGKSHVFKLDGSGLTGSGNFTPTEVANVVGNVDSQSSSQYPPGFTAADISADGQMLVAQNYDEIFIWNRSGSSTFVNSLNAPSDGLAPCYYSDSDISGSTIPGSEAVTFSPNGRELSFITEGNGSRIRTFENTNVGGNPDTQPPSVPSGLSGSAPSTNQVNLSWSASTDNVGVSGYNIYRNGSKITNLSGTSYNDTSVSANTTYSYTVSAYDAAGNTSAQSSSVSVTTPNNQSTKLANVNNLTAIAQDGQVTLNWDAVTNANNYTVRWGTGGNWSNYSNDQSNSNNPTTNNYIVTGLTNGTTYNFAVAARDSTGTYTNGDYSSTVTATPEATPVTKLGDADGDGDVDLVDLARLLSDYGKSSSPADFNDNGVVDLADLAALLSNYGK